MLKQAKRFLKKEPAKPREESASRPILPPGSRPLEHAGPSIVVPPTEAAIAAVNANKGYSGSVLASKLQDQQLTSPKIPAGSIRSTPPPPESNSDHGQNPSTLVAEPSNAPLHVSPRSTSPEYPHKALSPARAEVPSPSAASYHAEASGASYTSSTGSGSRPHTHSPNARNHRAAVHAANERLQKALQLGAKQQPASAGASGAAASVPLSSGSPGQAAPLLLLHAIIKRLYNTCAKERKLHSTSAAALNFSAHHIVQVIRNPQFSTANTGLSDNLLSC